MSNQTWTYVALGSAARALADRLGGARARAGLDVVLARCGSGSSRPSSLYVLAAFVLAGVMLGGGFLWYFDEL